MTGTPCCLALAITAAADGESRFTINSTFAPPLSIGSAIVANFALSPLAFWISASTPASWKAFCSNGRSAPSQRAEEAVSGRITPTLALAAGVLVALAPLLPLPLLDESSLPQAATLNASAAVTATAPRARNCIWVLPFSVYSQMATICEFEVFPAKSQRVKRKRRSHPGSTQAQQRRGPPRARPTRPGRPGHRRRRSGSRRAARTPAAVPAAARRRCRDRRQPRSDAD